MNIAAAVSAAVLRAADRITDAGLAARVIRDEYAREHDTAAAWIEASYVACPEHGTLVADWRVTHACSVRGCGWSRKSPYWTPVPREQVLP